MKASVKMKDAAPGWEVMIRRGLRQSAFLCFQPRKLWFITISTISANSKLGLHLQVQSTIYHLITLLYFTVVSIDLIT